MTEKRDKKVNEESSFVGRVYQNDAETLDREAVAAIKEQLNEGAKYLMPNLYPRVEPEVLATVKLLIWRHTVDRNGATYGQRLLGLSYRHLSPARSALYVLLTVGAEWLRHRLPELLRLAAAPRHVSEKVLQFADRAELLLRVTSLLNTLQFLRQGAFLTLTERLLRLRKRRAASDVVSETNYTYLTREHLWRGLSELLMCVLPLIDFRQLRGQLLRLLPASSESSAAPRPPPFTAETRCVWCGEPPVLPHLLQCCHLACYYCHLAAAAGDSVRCAECGRESDRREVRPAPVVRAVNS
ncbi:peroxisome biogenesis factor 2-like isoform X3 [Amphibalanus amphitrite]|uniref:peroxisome biogenesis factor 2-like isoform X3 n=2 Tax=Amphibalanus amphitrite TaxID=1232801 RepID=UPI001C91BDDC|nr:peroxisome biogenesis factor 2-like isoform X3 [Amphibalanus amphitrite]